ncbi:MAG: hypothetical protein JRH19_14235 [Deltaproteobacteria bacterium]|nr:hypothetical protein [Deltaproteobacteria bacterium]
MIRHFLFAAACVILLGCATGAPIPVLPYCEQPEEEWLAPDRSCQDDADFIAFRHEIDRLVVPAAGTQLVRVKLDDDVRIGEVCVVRGRGWDQWAARRDLAELLEPPSAPAALSGPPCAAGSGLELNRGNAIIMLIRSIARDCADASASTRSYINCLDIEQRRRGEIWVYGGLRPYRAFVPIEEPSARRTTLLACTEWGPAAGTEQLPPVGIARVGVDLEECMKAQGWNEVK